MLPDGSQMIHHDRYNQIKLELGLSDGEMDLRKMRPVHPDFRMCVLFNMTHKEF
jgi:hypothetical protein